MSKFGGIKMFIGRLIASKNKYVGIGLSSRIMGQFLKEYVDFFKPTAFMLKVENFLQRP